MADIESAPSLKMRANLSKAFSGANALGFDPDSVDAVHERAREIAHTIHLKDQKNMDGDGGGSGHITRTAQTGSFLESAQKRREKEDLDLLLSVLSIPKIEHYLDIAEEGLEELERLLADLAAAEALLDRDEHGHVDWAGYGHQHLSAEQMTQAGGDAAPIVVMLQEELLDRNGDPIEPSDLGNALALRKQVEEKIEQTQERLDIVREAHDQGGGNEETRDRVERTQERLNNITPQVEMKLRNEKPDEIEKNTTSDERHEKSLESSFSSAADVSTRKIEPYTVDPFGEEADPFVENLDETIKNVPEGPGPGKL